MTWLIQSSRDQLDTTMAKQSTLPIAYGMIHNPDGAKKCHVYFGPY